jgi:hypothetical protein
MRQHPIPQNVLDVEFKLFTRFSLKEFAYLATGVSVGGIFLYFSIGGDIPGIVGIPAFAIFAGAGAFLALVPINDQPADTFIKNYFNAINKPTQRVWLNEQMKEERSKPQIQGAPQLSSNLTGKAKVIGGSNIPEAKSFKTFQENPGDDILQTEPQEAIAVENKQPQPTQEEKTTTIIDEKILTISDENISQYQFPIKSLDKLPGNINIWLCTKDSQPLTGITTYLKDNNGKILYANKTGANGYFLSDRIYPPGIYYIEFENTTILKIRIVLSEKFGKLPLKIEFK